MSELRPLEWERLADRPLFYAGQVLNAAALTSLGEFAQTRSAVGAQSRGWGVDFGLLPFPEPGGAAIGVSSGILTDQRGGLLMLTTTQTIPLGDLTEPLGIKPETFEAGGAREFDLWLSIGGKRTGSPTPYLWAPDPAYAPVRTKVSPCSDPSAARLPAEVVAANWTLQPVDVFDELVAAEKRAFDDFAFKFNAGAAPDAKTLTPNPETVRAAQAAAFSDLMRNPFAACDGAPLARLRIKREDGAWRVDSVDWGRGRREQRPFEPPAYPGHLNIAPVFGLEAAPAAAWLQRRGIPVWRVETLDAPGAIERRFREDRTFLESDPQVQAGRPVELFTFADRVLVARSLDPPGDQFNELVRRLTGAEARLQRLDVSVATLFGLIMFLVLPLWLWMYHK